MSGRLTDHLETETGIDHEEDQVGDLADVDHGIEVVIAFDESEAALPT